MNLSEKYKTIKMSEKYYINVRNLKDVTTMLHMKEKL